MTKDRDYKREYLLYSGKEGPKKDRVARNRNRRQAERDGIVHKGDGKDIDHKDGNPKNNSKSNLRVMDKSKNRAKH